MNQPSLKIHTIFDKFEFFSHMGNIATPLEILQRRGKYCNDFFASYRCNISNPPVHLQRDFCFFDKNHVKNEAHYELCLSLISKSVIFDKKKDILV